MTWKTARFTSTSAKFRQHAVGYAVRGPLVHQMHQDHERELDGRTSPLAGDDLAVRDHGDVLHAPPHLRRAGRVARHVLVLQHLGSLKHGRRRADRADEPPLGLLALQTHSQRLSREEVLRTLAVARQDDRVVLVIYHVLKEGVGLHSDAVGRTHKAFLPERGCDDLHATTAEHVDYRDGFDVLESIGKWKKYRFHHVKIIAYFFFRLASDTKIG